MDSQPGKSARLLFRWLGWKWNKKEYQWSGTAGSERRMNGGSPTIVLPKKYLIRKLKDKDFNGFEDAARNARGLKN